MILTFYVHILFCLLFNYFIKYKIKYLKDRKNDDKEKYSITDNHDATEAVAEEFEFITVNLDNETSAHQ